MPKASIYEKAEFYLYQYQEIMFNFSSVQKIDKMDLGEFSFAVRSYSGVTTGGGLTDTVQ